MTVLSGRASPSARSMLRTVLGGVLALIGLLASGCGNTTFTYGTSVISFSVTPGPFSAYIVELDQVALTRDDKAVVYPLITPETVDFTKLTDMSELFGAPAVIEGTYVSATITVNYGSAQIFTNVNGTSKAVSVLDPATNAAAGTISYTVKFDPAHPLVIKKGVSTPLNFNFDLNTYALDTTKSPQQLTVRPMLTASTQPNNPASLRTRGVYVTTDPKNSNFTLNSRAFFDTASNPVGAIQVNTDANTVFNVNGIVYTGAAGLTAVSALQINTIIEAYGSLGSLNGQKPSFTAKQVYAGVAVENLLADRITGTVRSRSGNTLHIRGAEVEARYPGTSTGVVVQFFDDVPVTVSSQTVIGIDGQANVASPSIQLVSVGQQVDIEGSAITDSKSQLTSVDATQGLLRLAPTTLWGRMISASGTTGTVDVISLGGFQPEALTFTGTGSATGADSDPTAYTVKSATDLSALTAGTIVRFDGLVGPFGSAPPDFEATSFTPATQSDQVLVINWASGGVAAPFSSVTSVGIDVNTATVASAKIQSAPWSFQSTDNTIDLRNPQVTLRIVPDAARINQFAIGNPDSSTGLSMFHTYAGLQTQVGTVVNGTNKIQTLVAVGRYDNAGTFTAYRIDIVQLP